MFLSRRLIRELSRPASPTIQALRPLSTSAPSLNNRHKSPSLGDVTPDSVSSYKANLVAYREKLRSASAAATNEAAQATQAASAAGTGNKRFNATASFHGLTGAPNRIVKTLLYGTPAAQKEEMEMEQSYGKVLARGKYVHEIVLHKVKPEKVAEYVELIGEEYPKIAEDQENNVHLVGSWKTEIGEADTFGGFNDPNLVQWHKLTTLADTDLCSSYMGVQWM